MRDHTQFANLPYVCWTDSTIVLHWLSKQSSQWQTFVANRVADIHAMLPETQWRHVRSEDNPADLASRGVSASSLRDNKLWWHGPSWLALEQANWLNSVPPPPENVPLERKLTTLTAISQHAPDLSFCQRFSSWIRLLRVVAIICRWFPPSRHDTPRRTPKINAEEVRRATIRLLRLVQQKQFPNELFDLAHNDAVNKRSNVRTLSPFVNNDGLMCVRGRLQNSSLPLSTQHPIILKNHYISKLIIRHAHQKCLHGGLSLTLATLRREFWVIQAKKLIKSIIHKCIQCARLRADVACQLMGPLPNPRVVRPERPFQHCGLDYAGPLRLRLATGRGHKSQTAYIALFICMATKAIHLEVVSNYSTEAFLAALQRFFSRRGLASTLYSDRGTNFRGASRELNQAFKQVISDGKLKSRLANDCVSWKFIPAAAPHFGGLWEAGVRSVKHHLRRVLGAKTPTYEELGTLLCQIEACLNSRPLGPLSDDPDTLNVLTPAHFLTGGPLVAIPQPSTLDIHISRLSRWQHMQQMLEQLWRLWSQDYVTSLQHRSKWYFESRPIKVNQIVLLRNDNLPPTKWNLARVIKCHSDPAGLTRVVTIKTIDGEYMRPITKLALLPIDLENNPTDP